MVEPVPRAIFSWCRLRNVRKSVDFPMTSSECTSPCRSFNPRSRTGSDTGFRIGELLALTFQSTLPHGERPVVCGAFVDLQAFQSTLPHGERRRSIVGSCLDLRFQSTLPHGERPPCCLTYCLTHGFNLRSRTGSDH